MSEIRSRLLDEIADEPEFREPLMRVRAARETAATLRSMRKGAGLTQQALARKLGVSQARISQVESGLLDFLAPLDFVYLFAEACNTNVELRAEGRATMHEPSVVEDAPESSAFPNVGLPRTAENRAINVLEDNTDALTRQVPALRALLDARGQLVNLRRYMGERATAEDQIKALMIGPDLIKKFGEAHALSRTESSASVSSDLATILEQSFKPRSKKSNLDVDVNTLIQRTLAETNVIKNDVLDTIEAMIERLDEKLSAQMSDFLEEKRSVSPEQRAMDIR